MAESLKTVYSEYLGRETVVAGPDRPEKSDAEKRAEEEAGRLTHSRLRARYRAMSDADFEYLLTWDTFPRVEGWLTTDGRRESFRALRKIAQWEQRMRAIVGALPKTK